MPEFFEQQAVEQLAGPADERATLEVLVPARALAHDQQVGVRGALPEDHRGAAPGQRAADARRCLRSELSQRGHGRRWYRREWGKRHPLAADRGPAPLPGCLAQPERSARHSAR